MSSRPARSRQSRVAALLAIILLAAAPLAAQAGQMGPDCDGYLVPVQTMPGRCVMPFADGLGPVRHLVWHPSGAVVAAVRRAPGMVLLRDADGNGVAEVKERIGPGEGGSGIAWRDGWLYFASDHGVWRYRWPAGADRPDTDGVEIIADLPDVDYGYAHNAKGIAVGAGGQLFVAIGSASDNCANDSAAGPGALPCPQLNTRAGIWAFAPLTGRRGSAVGRRVATGLRNAMPLAVDTTSGDLWGMGHGRDALNQRWGWTNERSAEQPAEILFRARQGADFGWPYCMPLHAPGQSPSYERAPEYANAVGAEADCAAKTPFVFGFPGHWAPMSLALAPTGRDSMIVVFHGSRGRRPLREAGHHALIGSRDRMGAAVVLLVARPGQSPTRLVGAAWAPTGAIYLSDDATGRVWLVRVGNPRPRG